MTGSYTEYSDMSEERKILNTLRSLKPRFPLLCIQRMRVFGSVVRQEDREDSDVDLLVDFEDGVTLFDMMDVREALEHELGRSVDLVTPDALHESLKGRILNEARDV